MKENFDESQDSAFEISFDDVLKSSSEKESKNNYDEDFEEGVGVEESTNNELYSALDDIKQEKEDDYDIQEESSKPPRKGKKEREQEQEREAWTIAQQQRAEYENAAYQLALENQQLRQEVSKSKVSSYDNTLNEVSNKFAQTEQLLEEAIDAGDSKAQAKYHKDLNLLSSYHTDLTLNKDKYIVPDQDYYPSNSYNNYSYQNQAPSQPAYNPEPASPEFQEFLERNPYLNPNNKSHFRKEILPIAEAAYNRIELGYEIEGAHDLIGSREHMNLVEQEIKNQLGYSGSQKNRSTRGFGTRPAGLPMRREGSSVGSTRLTAEERDWAINGGVSGKNKNERIKNMEKVKRMQQKMASRGMQILEEVK